MEPIKKQHSEDSLSLSDDKLSPHKIFVNSQNIENTNKITNPFIEEIKKSEPEVFLENIII